MLTSFALIILVGLSLAAIFQKIHIPRIIGMLLTGIILGPYVLDLLDPSILGISSDLRQMALIIILIKAGISLNIEDLKKVGRPAILMSFLPALAEIAAFVWLAPIFLPVNRIEGAIMGAVLGAVSPAVVVPRTVNLIEQGYGTDKKVPQLIMAGASLDDVFVIVLFGAFVNMAGGNGFKIGDLVNVPVSIVFGIVLGAAVGIALAWTFEKLYKSNNKVRNTTKAVILLGMAFALMAVEELLEGKVPVSGLLAVMSMACALKIGSSKAVSSRLAEKYGKLWIAAEVVLFVLVGAAVDIRYTLNAGVEAVCIILIALVFRSVGVWLCLIGTDLNNKEKLFCVLSYLPKATVQAAIGSVGGICHGYFI